MSSLIAFCGPAGCGKDTAARILIDRYGYSKLSFGGALKDTVAAVFGWPREMLEGATPESRAWREERDTWWSERLGREITPRWVLQFWGTELCRHRFHPDIWVAAVESIIARNPSAKYVITDCRFPNEATMIRSNGGRIIQIRRRAVTKKYDHVSEVGLSDDFIDSVIDNNGSLDEFLDDVAAALIVTDVV